VPLDERACLERGQFMSGACAGLISKAQKLQSFHRELAEGFLLLHQPFVGSIEKISEPPPNAPLSMETPSSGVGHGLKRVASHKDDHERVAITG